MRQTEKQYLARLWQNDVGAWAAAEDNGVNRMRPPTCEQNYAIWRGLGTPMRTTWPSATSARTCTMPIRRPARSTNTSTTGGRSSGATITWPAATPASPSNRLAAGDVDDQWPAFDTIVESAYANGGMLWHATGSNSMEMEPLFLQAVLDGLFGIKPWFGDNLLVLRPSPPSSWNDLEIKHLDAAYRFHRDAAGATMNVETPVPRRVRVEIPVRGPVEEVTLDGATVKYHLESAVNCASGRGGPAAREHRFAVKCTPLRFRASKVRPSAIVNERQRSTFATPRWFRSTTRSRPSAR